MQWLMKGNDTLGAPGCIAWRNRRRLLPSKDNRSSEKIPTVPRILLVRSAIECEACQPQWDRNCGVIAVDRPSSGWAFWSDLIWPFSPLQFRRSPATQLVTMTINKARVDIEPKIVLQSPDVPRAVQANQRRAYIKQTTRLFATGYFRGATLCHTTL